MTLKRKSKQHRAVVKVLKVLFPTARIREDFPIKVNGKTLYIDIYLPRFNLAFEVNGEQHYEFNAFMHKNRAEFQRQKDNDYEKAEYCKENNIKLCVVDFNEEVTRKLILERIEGAE